MADKKNKKPKHTHLVVPGDSNPDKKPWYLFWKKDETPVHQVDVQPTPATPGEKADAPRSEGETAPAAANGAGKEKKSTRSKRKTKTASPAGIPGDEHEDLPKNAIRMPVRKAKPKLSPARRRRRMRRIKMAGVAGLLAGAILFYTSGAYLRFGVWVSDAFDSMMIAARPGSGFPMSFTIPGFVKAESMGNGGFAAVGAEDIGVYSSTGKELWRNQHHYLSPGLSAGNARVVVYNRGGKEYQVESRSKTIVKETTDQDILFCEMSPDGWLAVVTSSRHRANLVVYGPTYTSSEPMLTWPLVDDTPLLVAFNDDNRSLVLGCLSVQDGVLGSTLYLLRTDRDTVQTQIRADDARVLRVEYMSNRRVLAVYDRYTAVYNSKGEELSRYEYGTRRLLTSYIKDGHPVLVFGTTTGDLLHTVLLNDTLEPRFDVEAMGAGTPKVLFSGNHVFLLAGQDVFVYNEKGEPAGKTSLNAKALGLVNAGEPLVLTVGTALPLEALIVKPTASTGSSSAGQSVSAVSSHLGVSEPPPSSTGSTVSGEENTAEGETSAGDSPPEEAPAG